LSESFPELWLFALGGLFIAVVMAFPNGLAGLYATYIAPKIKQWIANFKSPKKTENLTSPEPLKKVEAKPVGKTSTGLSTSPLTQGVLHE